MLVIKLEYIKAYLQEWTKEMSVLNLNEIKEVIDILFNAWKNDKQIFILGNGGSATLASHFATDLSKTTLSRVYDPKIKRFRVISLTDNVGLLTAFSNDISYDVVFSQQLSNLVREHDIVIAITGSGNSPNVVKAVEYAKQCNAITIGLLGFDGGKVKSMLDHSILIKSNHYGRIEAMHSMIHHLIVAYLKEKIDSEQ